MNNNLRLNAFRQESIPIFVIYFYKNIYIYREENIFSFKGIKEVLIVGFILFGIYFIEYDALGSYILILYIFIITVIMNYILEIKIYKFIRSKM